MKTTLLVCALIAASFQSVRTPKSESCGEISTLYANDPLLCSLDLRTGEPGLVVQGGEVRNRDSHLTLGYFADSLTVGIQGGDTGAIVDLGTLPETENLLGRKAIGNSGNGYVTLPPAWVRAHAGLEKTASLAHAPIRVGHVYLVRVASGEKPDLFAKLLVLEWQAGASVTLRWQLVAD